MLGPPKPFLSKKLDNSYIIPLFRKSDELNLCQWLFYPTSCSSLSLGPLKQHHNDQVRTSIETETSEVQQLSEVTKAKVPRGGGDCTCHRHRFGNSGVWAPDLCSRLQFHGERAAGQGAGIMVGRALSIRHTSLPGTPLAMASPA